VVSTGPRWLARDYRSLNDHGADIAIYLCDSEENGLQLRWDRPKEEWDRHGTATLS
jgi:catechol-2,3-dioxygenase